jgi:hypothetical protein
MSPIPPNRDTNPVPAYAKAPHRAVVGMNVDDARWHLAAHGLTLLVVMRDGEDVSAADLKARDAVWVAVRGSKVDSVLARS